MSMMPNIVFSLLDADFKVGDKIIVSRVNRLHGRSHISFSNGKVIAVISYTEASRALLKLNDKMSLAAGYFIDHMKENITLEVIDLQVVRTTEEWSIPIFKLIKKGE